MKHRTSEVIPELHGLSKELRKLKHLFENYKNLIHKVMATTRLDGEANQKFPLTREGTTTSLQISRSDLASEDRRVILTKSALERFDRLADRLQWLMLNTIQGHLDEINALSDTVCSSFSCANKVKRLTIYASTSTFCSRRILS
jgi:hypothetical protein